MSQDNLETPVFYEHKPDPGIRVPRRHDRRRRVETRRRGET